jgi:hypothetical protein
MFKRKSKTPPVATFEPGEKVRVRRGVMDTDYADMPLGGWAGNIAEVHDDGMYTVRWSAETLASIHPVFKSRCENDGVDVEQYSIGAEDLEPDTGGPLDIEQPQQITTRPLSLKDQDDRIRMIFGLTSNDTLPDVDDETLETYYRHLLKHLAFPFTTELNEGYGHPDRVTVISLGDPDEPISTRHTASSAKLECGATSSRCWWVNWIVSKGSRTVS